MLYKCRIFHIYRQTFLKSLEFLSAKSTAVTLKSKLVYNFVHFLANHSKDVRLGSYIAFLPWRIQFSALNSASASAAAFLPNVWLVLSHCPTLRNATKILPCRIWWAHYVNVSSMLKFGLAKEKKNKTLPFSFQCNLNILQCILLHCQLSPSRSIDGQFFAKLKSFVLKFFADRHIQ